MPPKTNSTFHQPLNKLFGMRTSEIAEIEGMDKRSSPRCGLQLYGWPILTSSLNLVPSLGLGFGRIQVRWTGKDFAMKKLNFTEEQIAFALRQAEHGTKVVEVCRKMGVSEQTFYRWKKIYSGMGPGELRRLKQLEEENRKLKRLVADLSLDKAMLQDVISKKL